MLYFPNLLYNLCGIIVVLLAILIATYKWTFTYWKRKGVPSLEPSVPFGDVRGLVFQKESFGTQFGKFYRKFKKMGVKHGGVYMFLKTFYVPVDQEIIKNIMQRDFDHFVDRGFYHDEKSDPLTCHLFSMEGDKWRDMRAKLSPSFTSGKMRMMFETMANCTDGLKSIMDNAERTQSPIDARDVMARFTTDVISSCVFGLESNSLENPDSEFRKYGRKIFEISSWELFKTSCQFFFPMWLLHVIKLKQTKDDVESFFFNVVRKNAEYRERNNIHRKDFFHLLLQIKNRGCVKDDDDIVGGGDTSGMSMAELTAQAFIFFGAGYEPSASTMNFALFELARNQDMQDRLRQEIQSVLAIYDNRLTYEAMMEMKYMDCVINETFRRYTPVPALIRKCTKSYNIPGTSIRLDEGTSIMIPILGIHFDPEFYPDPKKFDPERFNEENRNTRPPLAHLPFGEGPRICIGLRFGRLQIKVGLSAILRDYKLTVNNQTELPLIIDVKKFIITTTSPIMLNVKKIS